jgi:hypothetical protein
VRVFHFITIYGRTSFVYYLLTQTDLQINTFSGLPAFVTFFKCAFRTKYDAEWSSPRIEEQWAWLWIHVSTKLVPSVIMNSTRRLSLLEVLGVIWLFHVWIWYSNVRLASDVGSAYRIAVSDSCHSLWEQAHLPIFWPPNACRVSYSTCLLRPVFA